MILLLKFFDSVFECLLKFFSFIYSVSLLLKLEFLNDCFSFSFKRGFSFCLCSDWCPPFSITLQTLIVLYSLLLWSFDRSTDCWSTFSQIDWSFRDWVLFWTTHIKSLKYILCCRFDWIFKFERNCINVQSLLLHLVNFWWISIISLYFSIDKLVFIIRTWFRCKCNDVLLRFVLLEFSHFWVRQILFCIIDNFKEFLMMLWCIRRCFYMFHRCFFWDFNHCVDHTWWLAWNHNIFDRFWIFRLFNNRIDWNFMIQTSRILNLSFQKHNFSLAIRVSCQSVYLWSIWILNQWRRLHLIVWNRLKRLFQILP